MKPVALPDNIAAKILLLRQEGYTGITPLHWESGEMKVLDVQRTERIKA